MLDIRKFNGMDLNESFLGEEGFKYLALASLLSISRCMSVLDQG